MTKDQIATEAAVIASGLSNSVFLAGVRSLKDAAFSLIAFLLGNLGALAYLYLPQMFTTDSQEALKTPLVIMSAMWFGASFFLMRRSRLRLDRIHK